MRRVRVESGAVFGRHRRGSGGRRRRRRVIRVLRHAAVRVTAARGAASLRRAGGGGGPRGRIGTHGAARGSRVIGGRWMRSTGPRRIGRRRRIGVVLRRRWRRRVRRRRGHAATGTRRLRGRLAGRAGRVAGAARRPAGRLIRRPSFRLGSTRVQIENLMTHVFQQRLSHAIHERLVPFHSVGEKEKKGLRSNVYKNHSEWTNLPVVSHLTEGSRLTQSLISNLVSLEARNMRARAMISGSHCRWSVVCNESLMNVHAI